MVAVTPIAWLFEDLRGNESLRKLVLANCDLGVDSVIVLASALLHNRSIRELSLRRNAVCGARMERGNELPVGAFTCEGLRKLLDALSTSNVSYLSLERNLLGSEGLAEIAEALERQTSLKSLGLAGVHPGRMMSFHHLEATAVTPAATAGGGGASRPSSPGPSRPNTARSTIEPSEDRWHHAPNSARAPLESTMSTASSLPPVQPPRTPRTQRDGSVSARSSTRMLTPRDGRVLKQEQFDDKLFSLDGLALDPSMATPVSSATTRRGFARFCSALKNNRTVTSLDLSDNKLGDLDAQFLSNSIFWPQVPRVTELAIGGNDFEEAPRDITRLAKLGERPHESGGLKWRKTNSLPSGMRPLRGIELSNAALSKALKTKLEFTEEEWDTFGVDSLTLENFIEVDGTYFQPEEEQTSDY